MCDILQSLLLHPQKYFFFPFYQQQSYDKIKIKTLTPQGKIVTIEHRMTSRKMTSVLMTKLDRL